ncbi:MAG: helix-turn-helix domain-containing protein [Bacteroidaceae bacterium]|nr:helix-turn-helix domain-containing protein [Bacteroidaceae bacterium]
MRQVRKCKFCGKEFVARSGMQKYCCEECQTKAKEVRKKRKQDFLNAIEPVIGLQHQEYLTFAKAAILMGCSRQYVYKLVNEGKLEASRISSRMAFIRKADIEKMLAGNPYHRVLPTSRPKKTTGISVGKGKVATKIDKANCQESEVLDYISGEEVLSIYKVKKSWLYTSAKRNQVPVCRIAGKNYYSRKHMNKLFGLSADIEAICEWLTMKEAQKLYGMSAASVRSNAYRHHIPTKREYGQTYYSKDHFEQLRRTDLVADDSYFTTKQAAEKYGMSTANVSIIVKKNSIATVRVGVKNLIPKADFDRIMEERLALYGSYHIF